MCDDHYCSGTQVANGAEFTTLPLQGAVVCSSKLLSTGFRLKIDTPALNLSHLFGHFSADEFPLTTERAAAVQDCRVGEPRLRFRRKKEA